MLNRCYYQVLQELGGDSIAGCLGQLSGWSTRLQRLPTRRTLPTAARTPSSAQLSGPTAWPSAGCHPHSLAGEILIQILLQPTFSSTLSAVLHSRALPTSLPAHSLCHTPSASSHHCASPPAVPSVCHPCACHLDTRCGKCISSRMCLL